MKQEILCKGIARVDSKALTYIYWNNFAGAVYPVGDPSPGISGGVNAAYNSVACSNRSEDYAAERPEALHKTARIGSLRLDEIER